MVAFTKHDLQFILDGIVVSETHAGATNDVVGNVWVTADIETSRQILRGLLPNSLEPIGMRTIDGELSNLEPGQDQFAATGNEFPRLTNAQYRDNGAQPPDGTGDGTGNPADSNGFPLGPPPAPVVTNTDYAVSNGPSNTSGSNGNVVDSDPRIISNLVVDQSLANPAAVARAEYDPLTYDPGDDGIVGTSDDGGTANGSVIIDPNGTPGDGDDFFFIPNVAPDEGLSAPFNGWMTFFGQFFDHGLDFIQKGGSGTIFMPLADDDPLVLGPDGVPGTADDLPVQLRFMALTRATVDPGEDGILGTEDDVRGPENFTSPLVDQNQTYTSHPSHQLFVREYVLEDRGLGDRPHATGALIEGAGGGMATWADVKAQAATVLGIELTDAEALDIPLFAVDQYGEFIRGANGLPQYVLSRPDGLGGVETTLVEGQLDGTGVSVAEAEAIAGGGFEVVRTKFAFLLDIAHNAVPVFDALGNLVPDADTDVGNPVGNDGMGNNTEYDDELLDAHFIAGDGRANENFALTAVHHVFHQEHNRLVEHTKAVLLSSDNNVDLGTVGDADGTQAALDLLNGYLEVPVLTFPTTQVEIDALVWDGDRLFQAAKFATEMQYQHLVFEEFARKVQPLVDIFASFEPSIDASITMEFSQAVYRFGHSMLTENVDLLDADGNLTEVGLVQAFLNPIGFNQFVNADGSVDPTDVLLQDSAVTAGAIARGMVREQGNEIDEFVTDALRNNLLGLPLDLASINIARGRDVGIPSLNEVRTTFFEGTGDAKLKPYESWFDFALHLKNELSIVNFIAAYGQHETITSATTLEDKRAAAFDLVIAGVDSPADRLEFLTSTGAWATEETGLNLVDLWIGGLAEAIEPFGGFLGSTFNFVFEEQLEDLQDGDRFYYLGRTAGLNFVTQLEQNSFANMIIRNTDIGDGPGDHLPGDIFARMDYILEVDQTRQFNEGLGDFVAPPVAIGESGTVAVGALAPDGTFSVNFAEAIPNAVVVLMLNTNNDPDSTVVRVVTADANGFTARLDEFNLMTSAGHAAETISWIAITEGEHVLPDGTVIKAGTTTADTSFGGAGNTVTFGTPFAADPVVLVQVTGANAGDLSEPTLSTQIRADVDADGAGGVPQNQQNATATGFQVRVFEQEANTQDSVAQVGWIAISQGVGTNLAAGIQAGVTDAIVADNILYGDTITDPVFLAHSQNSNQAGNTFNIRGTAFDDDSATVFVSEETSLDAETTHAAVNVGFLAISSGQILADAGVVVANGADPEGESILIPLVMRDNPSTPGPDINYLRFTGGEHVVLGGTEGNDTIIGGIGDDTIWGDGGDDTLEGGDGADIIIGGDGDDIITDIGGEDNLQGGDGNDAIFSGGGEDLILAGAGKDFVLGGPDLGETFGGLGDDFLHTGNESENLTFGGEGNDWLEGGGGNHLMQGDNGDPFLNSTVGGHDVFISGQGDDDYDAEGGDDIMEGGDGIQRFEGLNGFDWATYKDVDLGVNADMLLRAFDETPIPPSNASILDRFDSVEGLSGGRGSDILRGDNETRAEMETLNNGNDSVLRGDDRFSLIQGLRAGDNGGLFDANAIFAADVTEWGEGDIILGGAGSDLIEGRLGDDIIDGDLKLDVRLLVRDPNTDEPIATAFKMFGELFAVDPLTGAPLRDVDDNFIPAPIGGFATLQQAVFGRAVNPGNIHIVREIIDETDPGGTDFDTAEFSDVRANYVIDLTPDAQGFISVTHVDPVLGTGADLLRNIERLQFADQTINLVGGNTPAMGMPAIVDANTLAPTEPFVGQQLRATPGDISDADGFIPSGAGATIVVYIWQVEPDPGTGVFEDLIVVNAGGEDGPLQGVVITVPPEAEGLALRVRAQFQDGAGVFEQVFSAPTELVAPEVSTTPTPGDDLLLGTVGPDVIDALAGDDVIFGLGGNDIITGGPGSDIIDGGTDDGLILGVLGDVAVFDGNQADFEFALDPEGNLEIADPVTGDEDVVINIETLRFNDGDVLVSDILNPPDLIGTAGADILEGTEFAELIDGLGGADEINGNGGDDNIFGRGGADIIDGGDGNDIVRGNGGADELRGGPGDDDVRGGGGADLIFWEAGDGRDLVNGGAGVDTFDVTGDGVVETFRVVAVTAPNDPAALLGALAAGLNPLTEIVITRDDGTGEMVIAELRNVEELVINTQPITDPPAADPEGDTIQIVGDFTNTSLDLNTVTINGSFNNETVDISQLTSAHRVVFRSNGGNDTIIGNLRPQDALETPPGTTVIDNGDGTFLVDGPDVDRPRGFSFTADDIRELKNLVNGRFSENTESPGATGVRDLEGTGNNLANPDFGSADQPFIRLTNAHFGEFDPAINNNKVNPIFQGLDPRNISNIIGDQEDNLPKNSEDANIFFMAFGQYFDHGLDFLPKGGNGTILIGGADGGPPDPNNPADLTRGTVDEIVDGVPQHLNKTSPFVDQNQAYGSTELVGQFLREGDGQGGLGARLFAGQPDPSNPNFNLLPTLRELILHHWENDTVFTGVPGGSGPNSSMSFREYFTDLPFEDLTQPGVPLVGTLVDANGVINETMVPFVNSNFIESGHTLVGDANPFINLLDHFVAGDLRTNENYTLTSIHTIWARNHNFHVENLKAAGFDGTAEELFQAAKIVNEVEYQRVVFKEFADTLLGGLKGSGEHGFDEYNPNVDARISHEFAAAVYRVGHTLIGQNITVIDENGQPKQVPLFDAFLNPTNDAFPADVTLPYLPQPGFKQIGVDSIIGGIVTQTAEAVDFNLVDAVRNDLLRLRADLFSFNVARGWDVGLGTLNQVRADLLNSESSYIKEAISRSGEDLSPYRSWEDFRTRNGLSATVIAQFIAAYPDLVLANQAEIDAFAAANPDIELVNGNTVKGIDRVDLWVGGLAEEHINGGIVGSTFWVVLHEQFDRLQEGDRFYYLDRADGFDFYEHVEDQTFADIIARNTGLENLPEDVFRTADAPEGDDDTQDDADDSAGDGADEDQGDTTGDDSGSAGDGSDVPGALNPTPVRLIGTESDDTLVGNAGSDTLVGLGGNDTLLSGDSDDVVTGGAGDDQIIGGSGHDILLGNDGNDLIIGGEGNDIIEGGAGADQIMADGGDDIIDGGEGRDIIDAGAGNDTVYASFGDGDDVVMAGEGIDTLDLSAITADVTVNLGNGGFGRSESSQSGTDTLSGFENVVGGAGNDTIIGNNLVNVLTGGIGNDTFEFRTAQAADGDVITDFETGDKIDLSGIAQLLGQPEFELLPDNLTFTAAGQVIVRTDGNDSVVEGNTDGDPDAEFSIRVAGKIDLDLSDFDGVK